MRDANKGKARKCAPVHCTLPKCMQHAFVSFVSIAKICIHFFKRLKELPVDGVAHSGEFEVAKLLAAQTPTPALEPEPWRTLAKGAVQKHSNRRRRHLKENCRLTVLNYALHDNGLGKSDLMFHMDLTRASVNLF